MRRILLALIVVGLCGRAAKAQPGTPGTKASAAQSECPKGQQLYEKFCLEQRVIGFIICVKSFFPRGLVEVVTYERSAGDKGLAIHAQADVRVNRFGVGAVVEVDNRNLEDVVKSARETFNPEIVKGCKEMVLSGPKPLIWVKPRVVPHPRSGPCIHDPEDLIHREAQLVLFGDVRMIGEIFSPDATVTDAAGKRSWPQALDRYREEFAKTKFLWAQHSDVVPKKILGETAYYASASHGGYFVKDADRRNADRGTKEYHNDGESDHWTLQNRDGCWQIKDLTFNAAGEKFPP